MECAASLDVMRLRKLSSEERYEYGIRLLEGVVAMLAKCFERQRVSGQVAVAVAVKVQDHDHVHDYVYSLNSLLNL